MLEKVVWHPFFIEFIQIYNLFILLDMENVWMEIIEERLKRNCESAVTKYSVLYHKKVASKNNGLVEMGSKIKPENKRFPIFQPMKRESDNFLNGTVQYAYTPITMVLIEQRKGESNNCMSKKPYTVMEKKICNVKQERQKNEDDEFEWPGVNEVMEAYHKYARGES